MFCPSCGAADQKTNAYCRQCGKWLPDPKSASRGMSKPPQDRMNVMIVFSAVNALLAVISSIALYATYLGTDAAKWSMYFAAAALNVIAVHQSISFFFALGLRRRFKRGGKVTDQTLESDLATDELSPDSPETGRIMGAPSVVEDTTQLLEAAPMNKPRVSERS
jgi:hypothetical protein